MWLDLLFLKWQFRNVGRFKGLSNCVIILLFVHPNTSEIWITEIYLLWSWFFGIRASFYWKIIYIKIKWKHTITNSCTCGHLAKTSIQTNSKIPISWLCCHKITPWKKQLSLARLWIELFFPNSYVEALMPSTLVCSYLPIRPLKRWLS